ncbi:MAG: hypothetical protein IJZ59_00005 [Alphaproteobacteria bacterium]|nr:hypothetical protein [Alphaproteobacteria bacterium]
MPVGFKPMSAVERTLLAMLRTIPDSPPLKQKSAFMVLFFVLKFRRNVLQSSKQITKRRKNEK